MNFPLFLSATAMALGLPSFSATAASVFEASQSFTFTVIQSDDDVAITYAPDAPFVSALATGTSPTFASASALGTAADATLTMGSFFDFAPAAFGTAGSNAVPNTAKAEARKSGTLTLENTSQIATQIVFDILFDMTWLATVEDPKTETASAEVLFEILLGENTVLSKQFKADTVAGLAGGTDANEPNSLRLVVELGSFGSEAYTIRAISKGSATTVPSIVPLPAAAWLLIGGLGGLVLVGRRRGA